VTSNNNPNQPNTIPERTPENAARDHHGRYTRDLNTAARDTEIVELRKRGMGVRQIARHLGLAPSTISDAIQRVLTETIREPGEQLRQLELERLDDELQKIDEAEEIVKGILAREHVTVSQGRVVYDDSTGQAVRDDAIVLQCVDRLMRLAEQRRKNGESRRKLLGMDQPPKVEVTGGITYEIVGINPEDLR